MQRLRHERGIALVMALGLMVGFAIIVTGAVTYSTSNTRSANSSQKRVSARQVAEAGMAAALAVLDNGSPTNSAALGSQGAPLTTNVDGGTATYWGQYMTDNGTYWNITSIGSVSNPSGGSGLTTSQATVTAKVPIAPSDLYQSTPANNPWTFWWSTDTANACDQTFTKQVSIPLVMYGDLCVDWATGTTNPSGLVSQTGASTALHMKTANSTIWVKNMNARVGSTTGSPTTNMTGFSIYGSGLQCKTSYNGATGLAPHACSTNKMTANASNLTRDNVYTPFGGGATSVNSITADFDYWYANASPGPFSQCNASSTRTGTAVLPVFENETSNPTRNNSLPTVQDLTPSGGTYDCIVGTNAGASNGWCNSGSNQNFGEIKWDGSNLEVVGTLYFDGSVKISNSSLVTKTYTCWGSIYTSGTILVKNTKLCGALLDSDCNETGGFDRWWPFWNWLFLVADGDGGMGGTASQGGDVAPGDGIKFINSFVQGGAYATKAIHFDASAATGFQGPAMAGTLIFDKDFKSTGWDQTSSRMPTGTPGIQQNTKTKIQQPIYGG